jgi:hypothetical protein
VSPSFSRFQLYLMLLGNAVVTTIVQLSFAVLSLCFQRTHSLTHSHLSRSVFIFARTPRSLHSRILELVVVAAAVGEETVQVVGEVSREDEEEEAMGDQSVAVAVAVQAIHPHG